MQSDRELEAIRALAPQLRCFALVGAYLATFAFVEITVVNALASILGLNPVASMVIGRNMAFIEKVRAVRTLTNHAVADPLWSARFDDLCKRLEPIAQDRNIIAHTAFVPSDKSDGVLFYTIEAKRHFKVPTLDLSVEEFGTKMAQMRDEADQLDGPESAAVLSQAMLQLRLSGEKLALVNMLLRT